MEMDETMQLLGGENQSESRAERAVNRREKVESGGGGQPKLAKRRWRWAVAKAESGERGLTQRVG